MGAEPVSEPLSVGAVSVPPAASSFLCFWPQSAICYLFFNLVAWSDAKSVGGWNNRQERKIPYLCQRLVYIKVLNMRNSIMSEASLERWLSHHFIFLSFLWLMFYNNLKCLCFKGHLALSFRNIFATIKILLEEVSKWQRDC